MPVNVGGRGSPISFQDLQDFYGGMHPISLSEYYRGGAEVPSTSISGNNPYTGTTRFTGSGTSDGGSDGISVDYTSRDNSVTVVNANSGVTGSVRATIPGTTSNQQGAAFSGTVPAGTGFTFTNFGAPGVIITSFTSTAASNRNTAFLSQIESNPNGNSGPFFFNSQQPRATFSGRAEGVRSVGVNAQSGDFEPRGHNGGTFSGFRLNQVTSPTTYNVRYTNDTAFTINNIVTNHGTFNLGPNATRDFNGVSSNDVSRTDHPAVTQNNPRGQFVFTNNTGQNISLSTTAMGGNAQTATLARGGTIDTGIINGDSEAWTFSYDIVDAGTGSGTADATVDGIAVDVQTTPGSSMTVFGSLTTSTPISRGVGNFVITDWPNVSYVQVTQGGRGNHTIVADNRQYYSASQDDLPTSTFYVRGGAFQSGDAPVADNRVITFGIPANSSRVGFSGFRAPTQIGRRTRSTVTNPATHDVVFTNNTGSNIILDSDSSGGARTLNNGESARVIDDASSSSWRFDYRYAPSSQAANTAIPTDPDPDTPGPEIDLDSFNTPGNAAP